MINMEDLEDYYEELETQTIEKEKKRDKKVITKMVVDGTGIKTVIINRRYKKLLEEDMWPTGGIGPRPPLPSRYDEAG